MKRLFLIGGPMGVGKTTVGQLLKRRLPRCVYLDGDWCWDMDPFQVTDATRTMVLDNGGAFLRRRVRFVRPPGRQTVRAVCSAQPAESDQLRQTSLTRV